MYNETRFEADPRLMTAGTRTRPRQLPARQRHLLIEHILLHAPHPPFRFQPHYFLEAPLTHLTVRCVSDILCNCHLPYQLSPVHTKESQSAEVAGRPGGGSWPHLWVVTPQRRRPSQFAAPDLRVEQRIQDPMTYIGLSISGFVEPTVPRSAGRTFPRAAATEPAYSSTRHHGRTQDADVRPID